MVKGYPWKLVGPWYRSESAGGPPPVYSRRPILQKYAASDFVDEFMNEPQHSLRFVCEDFANRLCLDPNQAVSPGKTGQGKDYLKLFLGAHSRFYLVVCELHCQAPGFPNVDRSQVCEAGFVVRKWASQVPDEARLSIGQAVRTKQRIQTKLMKIEQKRHPSKEAPTGPVGFLGIVGKAIDEVRYKKRLQLLDDLKRATGKIQELGPAHDISLSLKGWVSGEHKGVGSWTKIEQQTPQDIEEEVLPLYPLIPDPGEKGHTARGKTVWFGVVPLESSDVDNGGHARFDDESLYEIRCFVRRHQESCPKKPTRDDCPGKIWWSEPTENYRIAPFFDLDGSGHKPINIRLPDLNVLEDQVARGPVGKGVNVRMTAPEDSMLKFKTEGMGLPTSPERSGQVCFFSIPLISIVALFVLNIFLPIVVFLFNLWFLLKLKLCIPPSFSIDVDLAADLKVLGPEFEASIKAVAGVALDGNKITLGGDQYDTFDLVKEKIKDQIDADSSLDQNLKTGLKAELDSDFDGALDRVLAMATDFSDTPADRGIAGQIPLPADGLIYFKKVPRQ